MGKVESMSNAELEGAVKRVWDKYIEDWDNDDLQILYEDYRRKRFRARERFIILRNKKEFSNEEWIKFIGDIVSDIYGLETEIMYRVLSSRWLLSSILANQKSAANYKSYCEYKNVIGGYNYTDAQKINGIVEKIDDLDRKIDRILNRLR